MDVAFKPRENLTACYHCGEPCVEESIKKEGKSFCCQGCKMVYDILNENNLCEYYNLDSHPGTNQKTKIREGKFAFLDEESIQSKLLSFKEGDQSRVVFYLPQMHCNSCIWLLEHLNKIESSILFSQVNFLKKEITVTFLHTRYSLRKLAELLSSVGYEPHISLRDVSEGKVNYIDRSQIYKIGVAGFAFGNIMMLSFPEYFSSGNLEDSSLKMWFGYLNVLLSIPVFFYSASEFFISGYAGLRRGFLNIDAPIALAVLITFSRSLYEIFSNSGVGYFDSMSGIVFFMLLGRYFQNRTYETLSFERDYTSYFPVGVTSILKDGTEKQVPVSELKEGMRIRIHAHEIIPADSILFFGKASIDYSFVTGESVSVEKSIGEIIYAGGKQTAGVIELEVVKSVSQSYLTQLWNNDIFKKASREKKVSFVHSLSQYFSYILFLIAVTSFVFWQVMDSSKAWDAVTAVLIVACPCALLLSSSFTYGNMLRVLQKYNFYLRNSSVIESLSESDTIVFDKTGTITSQESASLRYYGKEFSHTQAQMLRSLVASSNHPLSKLIFGFLPLSKNIAYQDFIEEKGKGLRANFEGKWVQVGSADFLSIPNEDRALEGSRVYVAFENIIWGYFLIENKYREGLHELVKCLKKTHSLYILSGDNNSEHAHLEKLFGKDISMNFNCKPNDKLNFIKELQKQGNKVMMLGDGLNDAGALMQSDTGVAITDNINNFSPACDAILEGKNFYLLDRLIRYCKTGKISIGFSFLISILYNLVGLYFAVQGNLQPVIAAILMPLSSVSIVLLTTGLSSFFDFRILADRTINSVKS